MLPLYDSILRLFRRPAKASRTMPLRTASAEQPALSRFPSPGVAESGAGMTGHLDTNLDLLLANGRAAAERLSQAMDPTAERAKPKPTKFTAQCQWCLEPFDREPRTLGELERLRQVLLVTGYAHTAPIDICNPCYDNALAAAMPVNGHTGLLDIGGDNHGPPNMLLRQHYQ